MPRQTRTRRTKHRGNAAGMVESRGRTGRKPTATEKRASSSARAGGSQGGRRNRYDKPPTWRGAAIRAVVAAAIVYGIMVVAVKNTNPATDLVMLPVILAVYTPLMYYTDRYMYRRQQRRKASGR